VSKPAVCGHTASRTASPDKVARDTDLDINEIQIATSTRWALGAGEDVFRRIDSPAANAQPPSTAYGSFSPAEGPHASRAGPMPAQ
jgi:hypothetical protein